MDAADGAVLLAIALVLTGMGVLAKLAPRNEPRVGVLGIATQRGDRLFLSLLGSAFIHLAWIGLAPADLPLWIATPGVSCLRGARFPVCLILKRIRGRESAWQGGFHVQRCARARWCWQHAGVCVGAGAGHCGLRSRSSRRPAARSIRTGAQSERRRRDQPNSSTPRSTASPTLDRAAARKRNSTGSPQPPRRSRAWRSTSSPRRSPRTSMNRKCWRRPSPRSPASRSRTT